ncbi:Uncharacterized protein At2g33490, partial [Linum grandiflorum]
ERGRGKKEEESFSVDQVQAARDQYDEEATLFVFRLKSLKEGQSRSLLTQTARHHAAQQMSFFKKALKALEDVEPHVKSVTEQRFINYHFDGLDEDDGEDDDDSNTNDTNDDGELSFQHDQNDGDVSTSSDSMEVSGLCLMLARPGVLYSFDENPSKGYRSFSFRGDSRTVSSQSAPLYAVRKSASVDKMEHLRPSFAKKFNSYVLPTPGDSKGTSSTLFSGPITPTFKGNGSGRWSQSNFQEPKNHEKLDSNNRAPTTRLTPPLMADRLLLSRLDPVSGISDYNKKIKRQAFSGPIARKSWSSIPSSLEKAQGLSGPLLQQQQTRIAQMQSSSPRVSPSNSPTILSSPRISELNELPRPPPSRNIRPWSFGGVGHSAPLFPRAQMRSSATATAATPLPVPSQVSRSLSIPSSGQRSPTESPEKMVEEFFSPPLTPISADSFQTSNRMKNEKS